MNLFSFKPKTKKPKVYWVIQEAEKSNEDVLVKYFNDKNEVIFEETFKGIVQGVIDEVTIQKLNQTKNAVLQKLAYS